MQEMKWRNCKTDPSEEGKKVLCARKGDIYVAIRLKNKYVPMPFATHPFAKRLSDPEVWCEIDFPDGLTGKFFVSLDGLDTLVSIPDLKSKDKDLYNKFCDSIINAIGNKKSDDKLRTKYENEKF